MTKDHFLLISYGIKWPLCVDVPLNTYSYSFIQSVILDADLSIGVTSGAVDLHHVDLISYL